LIGAFSVTTEVAMKDQQALKAKALTFRLNVDREEAMRYYRGEASAVVAITDSGQSLQFPALHVRRFITQSGIHGRFKIRFDDNHKMINLERISD
jgi:hypothetical protein